ncbi:hypothetical protein [Microbacterium terricola]|uniref:Integral membrane protein n=1 Tax=Microbacterium terricola TaxID=344163 RepID=A0ABM8DX62_9MICO|nr:hypothetical protein [Microbacterium terricola]UYK39107.1 hypothetical protein OAU46_10380 [Microbacterium terricola]BDV30182.1 hypothetical protein Microterr_08420 [Microbacterium terricola]
MTIRQLRALRAAAAASVAVVVSAAAHTLAGGGAPPPALLLAVVLLAWPVCVAAVGRRLSLPGLTVAVLASQALFHLSFALVGAGSGAMAAHTHHGAVALSSEPAVGGGALLPDTGMTVHHLVAALVTVAALHRGERMLRAIASGIARLLPRIAVTAELPRAVGLRLIAPSTRRAPAVVFLTDAPRRGPPVR